MKKRDKTPYENKAEMTSAPSGAAVIKVIKAYDGIEVGTIVHTYDEKLRCYMFANGFWSYEN